MSGARGKNDAADAASICEAVQRPDMHFVPPRSLEQQSQLMVHRARHGYVQARTACINRIRGLLSEFGHVLSLKADTVRRQAGLLLEELPGWGNTVIGYLLSELHPLDERIAGYDHHIAAIAREDARTQQLIQLRGVGPTTATTIVAMIGSGHEFRCGGQEQSRLDQPLGHRARAAARLLEGGGGHCSEECANGLGGALARRMLRDAGVARTRIPLTKKKTPRTSFFHRVMHQR